MQGGTETEVIKNLGYVFLYQKNFLMISVLQRTTKQIRINKSCTVPPYWYSCLRTEYRMVYTYSRLQYDQLQLFPIVSNYKLP